MSVERTNLVRIHKTSTVAELCDEKPGGNDLKVCTPNVFIPKTSFRKLNQRFVFAFVRLPGI